VGKSISDMTIEGRKNPVGKVLGRAIKAAGTFILVPLMAFVLLQLSTIVVVEVSDMIAGGDSVSGGSPPTMGTIIFLTGSLDAGKTPTANPSFTDSLRIGYYNGEKSYTDMDPGGAGCFESQSAFDTVTCIVLRVAGDPHHVSGDLSLSFSVRSRF
jgi:hypothetical protein